MDTAAALIAMLRLVEPVVEFEATVHLHVARPRIGVPYLVVRRSDATRVDVLEASDVSALPDEETFEIEIAADDAAGGAARVIEIADAVVALLHGSAPTLGERTAQYVEVAERDEGFVGRGDAEEQGIDTATLRVVVYY